jgi:hypothetical protein
VSIVCPHIYIYILDKFNDQSLVRLEIFEIDIVFLLYFGKIKNENKSDAFSYKWKIEIENLNES